MAIKPNYIIALTIAVLIAGCSVRNNTKPGLGYEIIAWQRAKARNYAHADIYVPKRIPEAELKKIAEKILAGYTLPLEEAMLDFHLIKSVNSPAYAHSNFKKGQGEPDFKTTFICGISQEDYDRLVPIFKSDKRDILGVWLRQAEFITVYKDNGQYFIERTEYERLEDKFYKLEVAQINLTDLPLGAQKINYMRTDTFISYWGTIMGYPASIREATNPSAYIIDSNGQMVCMDYEPPLFLEKIR